MAGAKSNRFTTFDMTVMASLAAAGIASKRFISPAVSIFTDFIRIPGGSTAGGFYMMFLIVGALIVKKRHTAATMGFLQGALAIVMGIGNFQGILSLVVYTLPGVAIDLVLRPSYGGDAGKMRLLAAGIAANATGSTLTNLLFFRLAPLPFALWMSLSMTSGAFGGLLAHMLSGKLKAAGVIKSRERG